MSILSDKINSYAIETGIEFNEPYQLVPTQTGSIDELNSTYWVLSGRQPVHESTVGPAGGSGSWKFVNNATNGCYFRTSGGSIVSRMNDQDFSTGVWVRFNSLPTGVNTSTTFMTLAPGTTAGSNIGYRVFADGSTPKFIVLTSGTTFIDVADIQLNTWYYVASRRASGTLTYYINAQAVHSETRTSTANGSLIGWNNSSTSFEASLNLSNFYIAASSVIGPTQISEIWTAGSTAPTSINYSATPLTASADSVDASLKIDDIFSTTPATATALIMHPTIIVTSGDSTYVTTSFIASTLFPSNYEVVANKNINITITETLNASAELINNVVVSTGTDESFSATEFTASAEFIEPNLPKAPMTASALMNNAIISVNPSYYNLVKQSNPVFYTNFDENTITNFGSWQGITYTIGSTVDTSNASEQKMGVVGAGNSWKFTGSYNNAPNYVRIFPQDADNTIYNLEQSKNFTIDYWFKPNEYSGGVGVYFGSFRTIYDNERKTMFLAMLQTNPGWNVPGDSIPNDSYERYIQAPTDSININNWNYVAIKVEPATGTNAIAKLFVNNILAGSLTINLRQYDPQNINYINILLNEYDYGIPGLGPNDGALYTESLIGADVLFDEVAIYPTALSDSLILDHFSFINNLDPNVQFTSSSMTANILFGNHNFIVTSNVNAIATPITGSADFAMPSVLATKVINYSAPALTASSLNTDVTVFYGWTIYPEPAIAAAESKEGFPLNTTYSDYIQANIAPYRYVTFDTATPYADFGTDNDYSVAATVVGGTIVNPDLGINGKSAKTAGLSYVTDGVILKESEHDDNWGTGNNSWHSSFWMERAIDDNSTTGLRVLWNLNGAYDDQNIILYHYQNKLHLQINNQVGAPITITSANNVNVFDYTRHNIVINSHHNNNKNHLYVYVDALLVLDQDINTYAVTTINNPIHVGANDEANNFPRLGIGCLITPFADTALPVVPTNTKLILDEIYWDKNQILQTAVTNIFNVMPDKVNANTVATALTASAEMSMPAISTTVNFVAVPATASTEFVNPSLYIERFIVTSADIMDASALMGDAIGFVQINFAADSMIATAIFDNAGIVISVPGPTMYASAYLPKNMLFNSLPFSELTSYMRYLRSVNQITTQFSMKEVV